MSTTMYGVDRFLVSDTQRDGILFRNVYAPEGDEPQCVTALVQFAYVPQAELVPPMGGHPAYIRVGDALERVVGVGFERTDVPLEEGGYYVCIKVGDGFWWAESTGSYHSKTVLRAPTQVWATPVSAVRNYRQTVGAL